MAKSSSLCTLLIAAFSCQPVFAAAPTFAHDVAPILYQHCAVCHHPGEVAPFSLLTYADAAKRARLIASVTASRYMPPWQPEPGYGRFQGERRLRDADIATLQRWAERAPRKGIPPGRRPFRISPKAGSSAHPT